MFKKWAKHKFKSYIYHVNQFLRQRRHKKWNQECKQKQSRLFNFCNIFDLLTPLELRKYYGDPLFLNLIFTYFLKRTTQENLRKFHRQVFIVSYFLNFESCWKKELCNSSRWSFALKSRHLQHQHRYSYIKIVFHTI